LLEGDELTLVGLWSGVRSWNALLVGQLIFVDSPNIALTP
jgi:hypothetical protein